MDTAFADRPASGALPRPGALALGGALALAAAFYAGNRRGWEGDDVNLLFGIASLDLVGRDGVYRYAWQPLSYEALAPLARRLANPFDLSYLANALGVAGLVLLVALAARLLRGRPGPRLTAAVLVASVPELWITALYFNTTALALPFFVGALWAWLRPGAEAGSRGPSGLRDAGAGALFATACLLRVDFLATAPFLLAAAWLERGRWLRRAARFVAGGCVPLALLLAARPELLEQASGLVRLFGTESHVWSARQSCDVLLATVGPAWLAWPLLLFAARAPLRRLPRADAAVLALSLLPAGAALPHLYSGKYLVPLFACAVAALGVAVRAGGRVADAPAAGGRHRPPRALLAATAVTLASLAVGVPGWAPGARTAWERALRGPRTVFTHDGDRTLGAYWVLARRLREPYAREAYVGFYAHVAEEIDRCPAVEVVVHPPLQGSEFMNPWYLGLLVGHLERLHWRPVRWAPGRVVELTGPGGRRLRLVEAAGAAPPDALRLDRIAAAPDVDFWSAGFAWLDGQRRTRCAGAAADR